MRLKSFSKAGVNYILLSPSFGCLPDIIINKSNNKGHRLWMPQWGKLVMVIMISFEFDEDGGHVVAADASHGLLGNDFV